MSKSKKVKKKKHHKDSFKSNPGDIIKLIRIMYKELADVN